MTESPIFFLLCEIKVSLCSKRLTKPYDPLFRNTREKRVNIREDIYSFSYSFVLYCVLRGLMWPRGYRRCIFSGEISGSDLAVGFFFFFCKFRPCFQVSFLFSSFNFCFFILLIISVKFTYSINRKLYFVSCFIQLTKLCIINYFRACRPWSIGI